MKLASSGHAHPAVHRLPGPDGAGAGGAVPAVLAHATGFHGRVWGPTARRLPGYACHAVDLRGHGDTPVPDGYTFPWAEFGDDVLAAADGIAREPGTGLVGIGHSAGGAALVFAEAARPGTFSALWLFEPAVFAPPLPGGVLENPLIEPTRRRRAAFAGRAEALRNFGSKPPMASFDPEALEAYVDHGFTAEGGRIRLKCLPDNEAQVYVSSVASEAYDAMAEIRCPVLLVYGERTGSDTRRQLTDRLPKGELEVHEDLDHFGPLTHPERAAASIAAWFGGLGLGPDEG
ncbi:alpha/beta fold hydrolase [Uniformispora flossi]|uniref:alpha/beta fold hydrolase n=1 Tax=Uniformispora flossi TaxID=3390723 RepID=UPI003C3011F8